jgi:predicted nucleic acid-binding protein
MAKGKIFPKIDSLIAATAITHNFILVTDNSKDFYLEELQVFNPLK